MSNWPRLEASLRSGAEEAEGLQQVGSGRLSRYEAVALGGLAVGGKRPDLAFDFPALFVYP